MRPSLGGLAGAAVAVVLAVVVAGETRAQTCTSYSVTVLSGEASYTSRFMYRTPGGSGQSLGIDSGDIGSSRSFTSSQSVEFGIYVVDTEVERWDPRASGGEIWFEDWNDDDYNDAGLRVVTSACSPPPPPPPPPTPAPETLETTETRDQDLTALTEQGDETTQPDQRDETTRADNGDETPSEDGDETTQKEDGDGSSTPEGRDESRQRATPRSAPAPGLTQGQGDGTTTSDEETSSRERDDQTGQSPADQEGTEGAPAVEEPSTATQKPTATPTGPIRPVTGHGVSGLPPPRRLTGALLRAQTPASSPAGQRVRRAGLVGRCACLLGLELVAGRDVERGREADGDAKHQEHQQAEHRRDSVTGE